MTEKQKYKQERLKNAHKLEVLAVNTHVPSKWRFVDLETGQVWRKETGADAFRLALDIVVVRRLEKKKP